MLLSRIMRSWKVLDVLMLVVSLPWVFSYITIAVTGHYPYNLLFLSRLLILGLVALFLGGIFMLIFTNVEGHLRIFSYVHGLFASATILTFSFIFSSAPLLISDVLHYESLMKTALLKITLPIYIALPSYFMLYLLYSLSAYHTLSQAILAASKDPPKIAIMYWRMSAIVGLILSLTIIPSLLFSEFSFRAKHIVSYAYCILVSVLLLVLSIDELWKGELRHVRYPIIAPLILHSSWLLAYAPKNLIKPITYGISELIYSILAIVGYVLPGVRVMFNSYEFNVPLFMLGLWLLLEWLGFYYVLSYETFGGSLKEGIISLFRALLALNDFTTSIEASRDSAFILLRNIGHSKIVNINIYLMGVDWRHFKKPIELEVKTISGMSIKEVLPNDEVVLYCRFHRITARHMLALKVVCLFEHQNRVAHVHTIRVV